MTGRLRSGNRRQDNGVRRLMLVAVLLMVSLFFGPLAASATEPATSGRDGTEATVGNASLVAGLLLIGGWIGSGAWWWARHRWHSSHTVARAASAEPSAEAPAIMAHVAQRLPPDQAPRVCFAHAADGTARINSGRDQSSHRSAPNNGHRLERLVGNLREHALSKVTDATPRTPELRPVRGGCWVLG